MTKDSFKQTHGQAYSKFGPDTQKDDATQWLDENHAALACFNAWA